MNKYCSTFFLVVIRMPHQSKKLTCIKKLESRAGELKMSCLASLLGDDDYFEVDNHRWLICMIIHLKLEASKRKRCLLRKKKH